ncbi:hypothetical protein M9H77_03730 [Catharanthus roseus]|uniref:Uncharacterized protein n=1 Tax=Catharanthus roseus TaxID=4058 RepID=A0ACC0CCA2_CATRO|nr:hypothetical protein M9H77_03730 [Catharanthus roseus]
MGLEQKEEDGQKPIGDSRLPLSSTVDPYDTRKIFDRTLLWTVGLDLPCAVDLLQGCSKLKKEEHSMIANWGLIGAIDYRYDIILLGLIFDFASKKEQSSISSSGKSCLRFLLRRTTSPATLKTTTTALGDLLPRTLR